MLKIISTKLILAYYACYLVRFRVSTLVKKLVKLLKIENNNIFIKQKFYNHRAGGFSVPITRSLLHYHLQLLHCAQ